MFFVILIVLYNLLVCGLLGAALGYAVNERGQARAERRLNEWLGQVCLVARKAADQHRAA